VRKNLSLETSEATLARACFQVIKDREVSERTAMMDGMSGSRNEVRRNSSTSKPRHVRVSRSTRSDLVSTAMPRARKADGDTKMLARLRLDGFAAAIHSRTR